MATNRTRLLNIGLHGATLGMRFLFIFFLAKNLDPSLVGYYGIFTATIGYSIYFVGLDFYTYSTREMIGTPMAMRGRLLKAQMALSGLLYLLFLPIAIGLLFQFSGWPQYLLLWFVPILLLEHINQEMFRLLVAMSEQISASIILFIRQGSWALFAVALMAVEPNARTLQSVMALWAVAGVAAACAAMWRLRQLGIGGWRYAIDWAWVRKGIAISAAFLLSTLALRGIQTFDRYFLEALGGIEIVGAYVLFFGVAGTLLTFLDAGIFAFNYPILIRLQQAGELGAVRAKVRRMLGLTILLSAGFAVISTLLLPFLLVWIDKPIYTGSIDLYAWLLTATIISAISMVPHYALYAAGCDRPIILSHIAALLVFLFIIWILSKPLAELAVPIGLTAAFTVILVWKGISYWALNKRKFRPKSTIKAA